jgi:hypothetical protein
MKVFSVWVRSAAENNADAAHALNARRGAPHWLNGISATKAPRSLPPARRERTISPQSESRRRDRRWFFNRRGYFKTIPRLLRLTSDLRVPRSLRGHIRNAARDAIGRGATEALNRALTQMGVGGGAREAIISSVRAAIEQIRVR